MRRALAVAVLAGSFALAVPADAQIVTREVTPGGLAFRHVHMRDAPYQALTFAWRDGSAVALPGKEALAWFGTTLMMEGPRGTSHSAMLEEFRDYQASVGLSATINVVQGHLTAPRAKFARAAGLAARVFADPALPAGRIGELARNWADSSRQGEGSAETMAGRLFSRLLIADGAHRRYITNDPAMYGRITVSDVEAWRRNILVREGLVAVAAGPMSAAEIGREIDRLFENLPAAGHEPVAPKSVLRSPGKLVVLERPVVQSAIIAGGPASVVVTPDLLRTQLAVSALGGGASSRLWRAVREKLGAAYGISAALQAVDLDTRVLAIRTVVANDKAKNALAAIREEYAHFVQDGLTDAELEPLKTIYVTGYRDRMRRAPAVAASVLTQALHDYPDDYLATYEQRLRGYGRVEVEADMRAGLPRPPLTIVVVAPSAEGLGADCVIKALEDISRCD